VRAPVYVFRHDNDPEGSTYYRWHFVYLHGLAERHNEQTAEENGWEWAAPDMVSCDRPMPAEGGDYPAVLYGLAVVAVLRSRSGLRSGRAAAVNVPSREAMAEWRHAQRPEEWR
jgi:hypothetical protein